MAAATFDSFYRDDGIVMGDCAGVWVMLLSGPPTVARMREAGPALEKMHRRNPGGFPSLTWVLAEAGYSMDGDARAVATEVTKAHTTALTGLATLIEAEGFGGAAARAIISGLHALSRVGAPKKVFANIASTVAWVAPLRTGAARSGSDAADVTSALRALRAGIGGRGAGAPSPAG